MRAWRAGGGDRTRTPRGRRRTALVRAGLCCLPCVGAFVQAFPASAAMGLSTRMGDMRVEGIEPGRAYDLTRAWGEGYAVVNRGDGPVEIFVEALAPARSQLKPGYEPLPDAAWLRLRPSSGTAAVGGEFRTDVLLELPDDPALAGRRFQAHLWPHTLGGTVGVGVLSRLRLETAPGKVRIEQVSGGRSGASGVGRISGSDASGADASGVGRFMVSNTTGDVLEAAFELKAGTAPGGLADGPPAAAVLRPAAARIPPGSGAEVELSAVDLPPGRYGFKVIVKTGANAVAAGWIEVEVHE